MDSTVRVRRSLLIAPAHQERLIRKLAVSAADVCILELEDGVHEVNKEQARQSAARLLQDLTWGGRERIVRINQIGSDHAERDIATVAPSAPDGIIVPKVESASEILEASMKLAAAEESAGLLVGTIKLWSMIETAKGLCEVERIASIDGRITALIFGAGDYGADISVKRLGVGSFRRFPPPSHEYLYARGRVVAVARANGIDPIDVGHTTFRDLEGTRTTAEISAQMGFSGCAVFSPRQVPVVNEAFSPAPEDIRWATDILEQLEGEATKAEAGTVTVVDGDMVDGPFAVNARDILSRLARIEQLEKLKAATQG